MIKKLLLFISVLVLSSFFVAAAADIRFVLPSPIVKNVDFYYDVEMNSHNDPSTKVGEVARIQVDVTSTGRNVDFLDFMESDGVWLAASTINFNGPLDAGKLWRFNIGPTGSAFDQTTAFKKIITLKAETAGNDQLALTRDSIIAHYPDGNAIPYTVDSTSSIITAVDSTCGDGVVGLVAGTTEREACDTALLGGDGCSADCRYIKGTHRLAGKKSLAEKTSCDFGARATGPLTCALEQLSKKEKFLARITAIFNLDCFPYRGHLRALNPGDANYNEDEGFCVSVEAGTTVNEGDLGVQVPMVLRALKEFYNLPR